jgi:hypothetical protein
MLQSEIESSWLETWFLKWILSCPTSWRSCFLGDGYDGIQARLEMLKILHLLEAFKVLLNESPTGCKIQIRNSHKSVVKVD